MRGHMCALRFAGPAIDARHHRHRSHMEHLYIQKLWIMHPTSALPENFKASRRLPLGVLFVDMCSAMWCLKCVHQMRMKYIYKFLVFDETCPRYARVKSFTLWLLATQWKIDKIWNSKIREKRNGCSCRARRLPLLLRVDEHLGFLSFAHTFIHMRRIISAPEKFMQIKDAKGTRTKNKKKKTVHTTNSAKRTILCRTDRMTHKCG